MRLREVRTSRHGDRGPVIRLGTDPTVPALNGNRSRSTSSVFRGNRSALCRMRMRRSPSPGDLAMASALSSAPQQPMAEHQATLTVSLLVVAGISPLARTIQGRV
jgi:hypothetical protein